MTTKEKKAIVKALCDILLVITAMHADLPGIDAQRRALLSQAVQSVDEIE